jgi:hypothetical protein
VTILPKLNAPWGSRQVDTADLFSRISNPKYLIQAK